MNPQHLVGFSQVKLKSEHCVFVRVQNFYSVTVNSKDCIKQFQAFGICFELWKTNFEHVSRFSVDLVFF